MEIGKISDGVVMVALLADQPRTGKIREVIKQVTADMWLASRALHVRHFPVSGAIELTICQVISSCNANMSSRSRSYMAA